MTLRVAFWALVASLVTVAYSYPRSIPLGKPDFLIWRHEGSEFWFLGIIFKEDDWKDGAYMAIARHNRNNTRVLFELRAEEGKIIHDPRNVLKNIKLSESLRIAIPKKTCIRF